MSNYLIEWSKTSTPPIETAIFKLHPADFKVDEELSFECSGSGEHYFIQIEKEQQNTVYVAEELAKWAGIPYKNVSYAGLKDRQSVSKQWFGLWAPGKSLPNNMPVIEGVKVLDLTRNSKKLKRGAIKKNKFSITLRDVSVNPLKLEQRIQKIIAHGVPNYYGSQRFGMRGDNIEQALVKLKRRKLSHQTRSILLSSVRSFLFNKCLDEYVATKRWNLIQKKQPLQLAGSKSWFVSENSQEEIQRVAIGDCSPSSYLYSSDLKTVISKSLDSQFKIFERYPELTSLLDTFRLDQAVRSHILRPIDLLYNIRGDILEIQFSLETGCYATSLLRELVGNID